MGDFSIKSTCLYYNMKFPTVGFILNSDMSAVKTAFHRPIKKMPNLDGFQELEAEDSQIRNYLPG